jgi:hypothetical protein
MCDSCSRIRFEISFYRKKERQRTLIRAMNFQLNDLVVLQNERVLRGVEIRCGRGPVDDLEERRERRWRVNLTVNRPNLSNSSAHENLEKAGRRTPSAG